jgi:hypothetical protein
MDLVRRFTPEQFASALESWTWIDEALGTLVPKLATAFGDVFLEGADGALWFLDTAEGTLVRTWPGGDAFMSALDTPEVQDRYLMAPLALAAEAAGLVAGESEVLCFTVPPILGGQFEVSNVDVADFEMTVNIAGQIHEQVRGTAAGTAIDGINIE